MPTSRPAAERERHEGVGRIGHDGRVRPLAVIIAIALAVAACGGSDDGDLDAYCDLILAGKGLSASNQAAQAADFEELLGVAPPAIRDAVTELLNTTRGLSDIDELDQSLDSRTRSQGQGQ